MAEGDIIMSTVVAGVPSFPCGGCAVCHALWGDHLVLVLTMFDMACLVGNCFTLRGKFYSVTATGGTINAAWDAAWAPGWQVVVDTLTFQEYEEDSCTTPKGATFTLNALAQIACSENLVTVNIATVGFPSDDGSEFPVFLNSTPHALDATITNDLGACPGGQATVSLP